jgi:hypothetical protein
LSRQIRLEREACCDALAAATCGRPLSVARTLVEVASSLQAPAQSRNRGEGAAEKDPVPAPLLAVADPTRAGELTDRVERLVDPDRAAQPRVSWLGLGATLLSVLLVGVVLQRGTDLAVRAAAELMSPRERVERLARLYAEVNAQFLPPATRSTAPGDAPAPGKQEAAPGPSGRGERTLKVTVTVRTEDGSPIPKGLTVDSLFRTGNSSTGETLEFLQAERPDYRKTFAFPTSRLRVGATAPGFAPTVSPLMNLFEGDPERTIEFVLRRGATATLRVTDERKRGIAGAELRLHARIMIDGSAVSREARVVQADDQGIIGLDRVGDGEYVQEVRARGFQRAERTGPIQTAAPAEWQLEPARPTPVQVVDAATGKAVGKARFELVDWRRSDQTAYLGDPRQRKEPSWLTFATTDGEGRATLSDLRDGVGYTFGVLAEGYGMALVEDVRAGQPEHQVRLVPPLTLAGRVIAPLERLDKTGRKGAERHYVSYHTRLSDLLSDSGSATVDAEGRFTITGLIRGERVTITVAGTQHDFVMKESRRDLELKAEGPAAAKKFPRRAVVIRLVGTEPGAPARGTLYVAWQHPDPECRESQNGPLPIQDNETRMTIPVGARLSFWPRNLAGYAVDRQEGHEITAGDGPQVIEAPARPAGGIHGTVVRADGRPAASTFVTAFATKLPPGVTDPRRLNPEGSSASPSFLLTLPLGGRYRVLARELTETHNVWTVSDEIALDDSHPIAEARLTLPPGRSLPIRVLDPEGRPVADQPVRLELSFSLNPGDGFSTELVRQTGPDGVALFENLAADAPLEPLRLALHVTVPPVRFRGWQAKIDGRQPLEVRLERGLSASGVLLEAETNKPIPRAEVRLVPRDFGQATYKGPIRTKTDARGAFRFEGLEDLDYTAYIDGTVPKGTVVTPVGGGARFQYPGGVPEPYRLHAGTHGLRFEVLLYPGSSLRTAD